MRFASVLSGGFTKGQFISKGREDSPKKQTNEFAFLPNGVLRRETPFEY